MSNITTDFVTTTKKIITEVRSVLTTLHLIREDVKVIRDQVVSDSNKQSADQQANQSETQQAAGTSLGAPAKINKSTRQTDEREQTTDPGIRGFVERLRRSARKPKFWIEAAALAGLATYTCETRRTNNLTDVALQTSKEQFAQSQLTTKEQFQADQRPFIWVSKLEPEKIKAGKKIEWNYWLTNYGKTPAVNARIVAKVQFGENANIAPNWIFTNDAIGNVLPQGAPLPPSKGTLYSTAYSDNIVDDPSSLDVDAGYYIFIHVEYNGLERKTIYTSNICFFHLKTGSTAACHGYNDIK